MKIHNQKGAVMVEFAIIALVFYFLAAGTLTFGQLFLSAQNLQEISRTAARELALSPLPAELTFEEALYSRPEDFDLLDPKRAAVESLRARLFDEDWLIIDLDADLGAGTLDELFATLPLLNQAVRGLMIFDQAEGRRLLRYPGALENFPSSRTGYRVRLPIVTARDAEGIEALNFVPVFEEMEDSATNPDPFLASNGGHVALRMNYPYQSASMSGFMSGGTAFDPNISNSITADDDAVIAAGDFVESGIEVEPGILGGPHSGRYGLGVQKGFAKNVRPFRKFLSAQSFFRREVFA